MQRVRLRSCDQGETYRWSRRQPRPRSKITESAQLYCVDLARRVILPGKSFPPGRVRSHRRSAVPIVDPAVRLRLYGSVWPSTTPAIHVWIGGLKGSDARLQPSCSGSELSLPFSSDRLRRWAGRLVEDDGHVPCGVSTRPHGVPRGRSGLTPRWRSHQPTRCGQTVISTNRPLTPITNILGGVVVLVVVELCLWTPASLCIRV